MQLHGLHHLTAVTGHAADNVRFYTQVLGMRLVKKTVNQDDVGAYHLFYGDELGRPGTELTFFDWPHVGRSVRGTGTISAVGLRVSGMRALEWWARRLDEHGIVCSEPIPWGERCLIRFNDPEGQALELVDDGGAPGGVPWAGAPVPVEMGIRGLHSVRLTLHDIAPTLEFMANALGFRKQGLYPAADMPLRQAIVLACGAGGPGTYVVLEERPELPQGQVGIGGVHHVAFRTPDVREQQSWRARVAEAGVRATPTINRYYFQSVYFREPGDVLFEIATDGPGFATDEDPAHLGERLSLPPFLEPHRRQIESNLKPL